MSSTLPSPRGDSKMILPEHFVFDQKGRTDGREWNVKIWSNLEVYAKGENCTCLGEEPASRVTSQMLFTEGHILAAPSGVLCGFLHAAVILW